MITSIKMEQRCLNDNRAESNFALDFAIFLLRKYPDLRMEDITHHIELKEMIGRKMWLDIDKLYSDLSQLSKEVTESNDNNKNAMFEIF